MVWTNMTVNSPTGLRLNEGGFPSQQDWHRIVLISHLVEVRQEPYHCTNPYLKLMVICKKTLGIRETMIGTKLQTVTLMVTSTTKPTNEFSCTWLEHYEAMTFHFLYKSQTHHYTYIHSGRAPVMGGDGMKSIITKIRKLVCNL